MFTIFGPRIYLALIVSALSFFGGAAGTIVSSRFDESKWRRETRFSVQKYLFAKRMELLERTIKAFNELQTLDYYHSVGKYSFIEGEGQIRAGKSAAAAIDAATAPLIRVKQAQTELSVVMTLDAIYFGPKTQAAVRELVKALERAETWWKVEDAKKQALLDATAAELLYGF